MSNDSINSFPSHLSDEEKADNLSATDEYFQIQEQQEESNITPINPSVDIKDTPEQNRVKNIPEEEREDINNLKALKIDDLDEINNFDAEDSFKPLSAAERKIKTAMIAEMKRKLLEEGWNLDSMSIPDNWLESDPPPREFLIKDFIPSNVVGIIGAKGGTGKSMLSLQLSVLFAGAYGGGEFFGLDIDHENRGKVLYLSAEDDRDECWRRIKGMRTQLEKTGAVIDWRDVQERLLIKSLVGRDFRFTRKDGNSTATPVHETLQIVTSTIKQQGDVKLLVVDTYSRFNGGAENSNEDAAAFIRACERVRVETGVTVLVLAHVNKNSGRDISGVSGGGRFIDSARWAAMITPYLVNDDKPEKQPYVELDMEEEEALKYLELRVGKDNYSGNLGKCLYMKRTDDGIMVQSDKAGSDKAAPGRPKNTADIRAHPAYTSLKNNLIDIIGKHQIELKPITRSTIKTRYCGTAQGQIGASWSTVNKVISAMLVDFDIAERSLGASKGSGLFVRGQNG